jgi:aryl-alcohol dehydrogenase-like predicted oxidoreductase
MLTRPLGNSGARVTPIGLGTLWWTDDLSSGLTPEEAAATLSAAIDSGINLIDTADYYGGGLAEECIGRAVKRRRDEIIIATKGGLPPTVQRGSGSLSRRQLISSLDASLRRLATDHIDLYQVHVYDHRTPVEETLETLDGFIKAGKVRYVGASNHFGWQMLSALRAATAGGWQPYISHQVHFSLIDRSAEHEVLPVARAEGLGVLVWGPLARGLLSGAWNGTEPTDQFAKWEEPPVRDVDRTVRVLKELAAIAAEIGQPMPTLALAWLLAHQDVTCVLAGARTPAEVAAAVKASDLQLSAHHLARLDAASAEPPLYPAWHQAKLYGQ